MGFGCKFSIGGMNVNCVGVDVSKGKSIIAIIRPLGEMEIPPFEVGLTDAELCELPRRLGDLDGETRVVMEATGNYHLPVASFLYDSGFYVSVVNAMLVHGYGNNSLWRAKTDKKNAIKLANYGLDHWLALPRYIPEDEVRLMLKTTYRQYQQCAKVQTMLKNNLISLLDAAFPDTNRLFSSTARADGSEKWVDFVAAFWHCECVCGLSEKAFTAKYQKWCKKHSYNSGQMEVRSRSISKRDSSALRRTLFLVMSTILRRSPADEPVYQFMDRKRTEGKPYRVYMMASAN